MGNVTSLPGALRTRWQQGLRSACTWVLLLASASSLHAQSGPSISARFSSIKGVVKVSLPGGGEKVVHKGDTIRSGTVISSGAASGASIKPLPALYIIVYPDTKIRFDKADIHTDGGGSVMCSIVAGKALFHVDESAYNSRSMAGFHSSVLPVIKVTVVTEEGTIVNNMGGRPQGSDNSSPETKTTATWTIQHDEGRTVVAVGEGLSNVSIGKGAAGASGEIGGQVKVPQGSVIWLFNRGGRVDAELVDTQTGKVTNLTGGSSSGSNLVEQSRQQIVSPSSGGGSSTPGSNPGGGSGGGIPNILPNNPSSNPDLSTPQRPLPVVSADTP